MYINLQKCSFLQSQVLFFGYIVFAQGISADLARVEAIKDWPKPTSLTTTQSFHGLSYFYRRFTKGFNTITTPITECFKKGDFFWTLTIHKAFEEIKMKLIGAHVLRNPDLSKVFEVACDVSGVGINGILSQDGYSIAYFSEKVNEAKKQYSTYNKKFHVVVQQL